MGTLPPIFITFDTPVAPATFVFDLDPLPAGSFTLLWNADNTEVTLLHNGLAEQRTHPV